jgi:hypothetical protein
MARSKDEANVTRRIPMKTNLPVATMFLSLAGALVLTFGAAIHPPRAAAAPNPQPARAAAPAQSSSSQSDQSDLSVTVYNSDLSLVRDVRNLTMPGGTFQLKFMDIAASVNPATVHIRSLNDPALLSVLEQNYEYDLLDPAKLLQKYVGREVTLIRPGLRDADGQQGQPDEVKATLIADNDGPVWKIGNDIVTGLGVGSIRFPEVPANLYDRPTLLWTLDNRGAPRQQVEVSYLAGKLSWKADYVLNVSRDETKADLDGWVTLVNDSGTAFENARLQLVAGDLNRVPVAMQAKAMDAFARSAVAPAPPPFQEEAFNEYHLYTLDRRTSVMNDETKQVSLLNASSIPLEKTYEVDGRDYYYRTPMRTGAPVKDPVQVYYKFKNSDKSSLGMPLPAGTMRIYQADARGDALFAGEDNIGHTPKDEEVSLHAGNAFDVVAERKETDYHSSGGNNYEMEYEITLRNHKDVPINVLVNEPIGGDWEILNSTYKWTKTAAFAAQFSVPVDKDGTSVLKYRVHVHW